MSIYAIGYIPNVDLWEIRLKKTNLLYHMLIHPLLQCDEIYLYAKNLEQEKYQN